MANSSPPLSGRALSYYRVNQTNGSGHNSDLLVDTRIAPLLLSLFFTPFTALDSAVDTYQIPTRREPEA